MRRASRTGTNNNQEVRTQNNTTERRQHLSASKTIIIVILPWTRHHICTSNCHRPLRHSLGNKATDEISFETLHHLQACIWNLKLSIRQDGASKYAFSWPFSGSLYNNRAFQWALIQFRSSNVEKHSMSWNIDDDNTQQKSRAVSVIRYCDTWWWMNIIS